MRQSHNINSYFNTTGTAQFSFDNSASESIGAATGTNSVYKGRISLSQEVLEDQSPSNMHCKNLLTTLQQKYGAETSWYIKKVDNLTDAMLEVVAGETWRLFMPEQIKFSVILLHGTYYVISEEAPGYTTLYGGGITLEHGSEIKQKELKRSIEEDAVTNFGCHFPLAYLTDNIDLNLDNMGIARNRFIMTDGNYAFPTRKAISENDCKSDAYHEDPRNKNLPKAEDNDAQTLTKLIKGMPRWNTETHYMLNVLDDTVYGHPQREPAILCSTELSHALPVRRDINKIILLASLLPQEMFTTLVTQIANSLYEQWVAYYAEQSEFYALYSESEDKQLKLDRAYTEALQQIEKVRECTIQDLHDNAENLTSAALKEHSFQQYLHSAEADELQQNYRMHLQSVSYNEHVPLIDECQNDVINKYEDETVKLRDITKDPYLQQYKEFKKDLNKRTFRGTARGFLLSCGVAAAFAALTVTTLGFNLLATLAVALFAVLCTYGSGKFSRRQGMRAQPHRPTFETNMHENIDPDISFSAPDPINEHLSDEFPYVLDSTQPLSKPPSDSTLQTDISNATNFSNATAIGKNGWLGGTTPQLQTERVETDLNTLGASAF